MKLLLSGEGPTDIGHTRQGVDDMEFMPGPMAWFVDRILERHYLGYSMLEMHSEGGGCVAHVHKSELAHLPKPRSTLLPGTKFGKNGAYYTRNAQQLAHWAKMIEADEGQRVLAVLFRDGDGVSATPAKVWQEKVDSMHRGFALAEFDAGVPMVPRPKSEAWLLCAMRPPEYANCQPLEERSGNDASPDSLKSQLAAFFGGNEPSADEQADLVTSGRVDPLRIDMPSFDAFREALDTAAQRVGLRRQP